MEEYWRFGYASFLSSLLTRVCISYCQARRDEKKKGYDFFFSPGHWRFSCVPESIYRYYGVSTRGEERVSSVQRASHINLLLSQYAILLTVQLIWVYMLCEQMYF